MLFLNNATIVTGDSKTVLKGGGLAIDGDRIVEVRQQAARGGATDTVLDLGGRLLMPGAINTHSHGGTIGPPFPSAPLPLPKEQALKNLDTHLKQGHTTVLNVDGFPLPAEIDATRREHPINLVPGTTHWDSAREMARRAGGGQGLTPAHDAMTAVEMLEFGAPLLGEVGGGDTLGGHGMDYSFIPAAFERETGKKLEPPQCRALKYAVFGTKVRVEAYDREKLIRAMREAGLEGVLTPDRTREILHEVVLPSFQGALDGIVEAGRFAAEMDVLALVHNSAPSDDAVYEAACAAGEGRLIAGHTNHGTFAVEECVASAKRLKAKGAWIEVSTLDMFGRRRLGRGPENLYAMLREGLVDFFSTDYAGGFWDGIYMVLGRAIADGVVTLPQGVAMVSRNAVRAIPRLAPDRGELAAGKIADLVVGAAGDPGAIEQVYVGGRLVVENGVVKR